MRIFFIKLIALIIFCLSLIVGMWWSYEKKFESFGEAFSNRHVAIKAATLFTRNPGVRVVFAGDSKAERGLDPQIFKQAGIQAINVAVPSLDIWTFVKEMELLSAHLLPVTWVISVGAYQINDGMNSKGRTSAEVVFSLTPWERLSFLKTGYFLAARTMLQAAHKRDQVVAEIRAHVNSGFTYAYNGFYPMPAEDYGCVKFRINSRASYTDIYRDIKTNGVRSRLFREGLKKLDTWRGNVVIMNAPLSKKGWDCLNRSYAEDMEWEFVRQVKETVADLKRVRFVDFMFDPQFRFSDSPSDYADSMHLNTTGAQKFTSWWLQYLKKEGWL